jgi:branched-chain amino acid transport system permease protein
MSTPPQENSGWTRYAPWILLAVVLIFPFILPSRYLLRTMVNIFFFAALGCAWNIIGGYAGQLSLGHAAFMAMGAYPTALLLLGYNVPPWLGFIPGVVVAVIMAFLLGHLVFGLRGPYLALSTLAFGEIVRILLLHFRDQTGGSLGVTIPFKGTDTWKLQFATEQPYYYICLALLGLCLYVTYRVHGSRMGYYLQAIKENQDAAENLGIDLANNKVRALMISAALTAVLGGFYVAYFYYIDPDSVCGTDLSIKILLVAIIGGVGTVWGPIIGSCILIPLTEISNYLFGSGRAGASLIIYAVILMLVVLFSPRGLIALLPGGERSYRHE